MTPAGGSGNSHLVFTGDVSLTASGVPRCFKIGAAQTVDLQAQTTTGVALRLTATDEQGGSAQATIGSKYYLFQKVGSVVVTPTAARFTGAKLSSTSGTAAVTVNGTMTC
ncbi:MAG: hypothetical protein M3N21_03835 [Actinomycetota bacterium]|nr:hypothetical protein [Actinomycetota bacterium]